MSIKPSKVGIVGAGNVGAVMVFLPRQQAHAMYFLSLIVHFLAWVHVDGGVGAGGN